jgi:hypothetical protein
LSEWYWVIVMSRVIERVVLGDSNESCD